MNGPDLHCLHRDEDTYPLHKLSTVRRRSADRARKLLAGCLPGYVLAPTELGILPVPDRCMKCGTFDKAFSFVRGEIWLEKFLADTSLVESERGVIYLYQYLVEAGFQADIDVLKGGIQLTIFDPIRFGRLQTIVEMISRRFLRTNMKTGHFMTRVTSWENGSDTVVRMFFEHIDPLRAKIAYANMNSPQKTVIPHYFSIADRYREVFDQKLHRIAPCQGMGMCGKWDGIDHPCAQCGISQQAMNFVSGELQTEAFLRDIPEITSKNSIHSIAQHLRFAGYQVSLNVTETSVHMIIADQIRYGRFRQLQQDILTAFSYTGVVYAWRIEEYCEIDDKESVMLHFLFTRAWADLWEAVEKQS